MTVPLAALCVAGTNNIGLTLVVEVDNAWTIGVFENTHCTGNPYFTTFVYAAHAVSCGIAINLRVRKIGRCSNKRNIAILLRK